MTNWSKMTVVLISMLIAAVLLAQKEEPKTKSGRYGAPTSTGRPFETFVNGIVKSVSSTELVVDKTIYGDDHVFKLTPKTKFLRDGQPTSAADLKPGETVFVDMKKDRAGNMVAKRVFAGMPPEK